MAVLGLPAGSSGVQLGQQLQANAMIFDDDGISIYFISLYIYHYCKN